MFVCISFFRCCCCSVFFSSLVGEFNPFYVKHFTCVRTRIICHKYENWTMKYSVIIEPCLTEQLMENGNKKCTHIVCAILARFWCFFFLSLVSINFHKIMLTWIKMYAIYTQRYNIHVWMYVRQEQACGLFSTFAYIENGISIGEEQVSDNASNEQLMRCIMRIFSSSSPSSMLRSIPCSMAC